MESTKRSECYGNLFPDLHNLELSETQVGKAFTATLRRSYGMGPYTAELHVNSAQWEQCVACEHYRTCYDLSAAKLMLATGVRVRT
jgi:hypothetical protein